MQEIKRYEILDGLPRYGPMYFPVTENGKPFYSEGFAVRFYKSDGTDWVANFKPGFTGLNKIMETADWDKLLVFAGGTCYLMNPDEIKPLKCFGISFYNIIESAERTLILQDYTDFTIVEFSGLVWRSERISWDGFKDVTLNGDLVTGLSFDATDSNNEWKPFAFNIKTKEITGGSYSNRNV